MHCVSMHMQGGTCDLENLQNSKGYTHKACNLGVCCILANCAIGYIPICKDVQLFHCGQLNGEGRAKASLAALLDGDRHAAALHIEALILHQLSQVHVRLLQQCMTCILEHLPAQSRLLSGPGALTLLSVPPSFASCSNAWLACLSAHEARLEGPGKTSTDGAACWHAAECVC